MSQHEIQQISQLLSWFDQLLGFPPKNRGRKYKGRITSMNVPRHCPSWTTPKPLCSWEGVENPHWRLEMIEMIEVYRSDGNQVISSVCSCFSPAVDIHGRGEGVSLALAARPLKTNRWGRRASSLGWQALRFKESRRACRSGHRGIALMKTKP